MRILIQVLDEGDNAVAQKEFQIEDGVLPEDFKNDVQRFINDTIK